MWLCVATKVYTKMVVEVDLDEIYSFELGSFGHHVYKKIWDASSGYIILYSFSCEKRYYRRSHSKENYY